MKLEIRGQGMSVPPPLHVYLERRLRFALGRFAPRIRAVVARLADINGPRGGLDKRCQITVRFAPAGELTVDDVARQFTVAIDGAADRAGRATSRRLQRETDLPRTAEPAVRDVEPE
jgi:ribosome-associated translation inhibitor RaiA